LTLREKGNFSVLKEMVRIVTTNSKGYVNMREVFTGPTIKSARTWPLFFSFLDTSGRYFFGGGLFYNILNVLNKWRDDRGVINWQELERNRP
jgi:hypothetical protein